jgi:GntR family transcriptional regulator of arabinose operon
LLRPALTTIHQPCTDIGTIAMQVMLERIEHPTFPARDIAVQPTLIVRQSCGSAENARNCIAQVHEKSRTL